MGREDASGWYYVSSTSEWSTIKNEKIQTSKSFKPLIAGEVAKNYIDYNSLPKGVQALITKEEVESGNTDKYIYTGSE